MGSQRVRHDLAAEVGPCLKWGVEHRGHSFTLWERAKMKERKRKEKKGRYRGRRKKVFFSVFILLDYDIGIKLYDYIDKMNNERKDKMRFPYP